MTGPREVRDSRSERGFTLVEALVAMVILAIGLIAVTNLMVVAASSNTVANQSTAAASIATQQLETLKAITFNDPALAAGGSVTSDAGGHFSDTNIPGVGIVHTRWEIADVTGMKFIRVRSEGTGVLSRTRSRAEFTTFRFPAPIPEEF